MTICFTACTLCRKKACSFFSPVKKPFYDSVAAKKKLVIVDKVDKMDVPVKTDSIKTPDIKVNGKEVTNSFVASKYVYTYNDGYVRISLPPGAKKYSIKFFDEKDVAVFEIKDIPMKSFKIDKSNFYHSGWFKFELYEDGKLFEKHKFLIPREY